MAERHNLLEDPSRVVRLCPQRPSDILVGSRRMGVLLSWPLRGLPSFPDSLLLSPHSLPSPSRGWTCWLLLSPLAGIMEGMAPFSANRETESWARKRLP